MKGQVFGSGTNDVSNLYMIHVLMWDPNSFMGLILTVVSILLPYTAGIIKSRKFSDVYNSIDPYGFTTHPSHLYATP